MLDRLATEHFDVLVIGGGITGVGVALDAASRGLCTALVEREDFASGTSSKSSKLIHGGLRYLETGDVKLVYESLHERQRLLRNAPHLVSVSPFLIPILSHDGALSKSRARALGAAMWAYDLTGGLRIGKRHRRLDADATFDHFPTLPRDRVSSGYLYYDATTDDARLTLTIARTAAEHGAAVANRCAVTALTKDEAGQVCGATVDTGDSTIDVRARIVIAAAGVWADQVQELERGHQPRLDSSGEGCTHHDSVGSWCESTSLQPSRRPMTNDGCSSCRGGHGPTAPSITPMSVQPTPTMWARSTARDAPTTTSRTSFERSITRSRPPSREKTSPACGRVCGPS